MLKQPLPNALDIRKAAVREAAVSGGLEPAQMQRFRALLTADEGRIEARMSFSRDEEERYVVRVEIEAEVVVTCQRCLEPMTTRLDSDNTLAIVWTDEQAAALPKHLEPLIVEEQTCDLHDVIEDELILALPPFSYHDRVECSVKIADYVDPLPQEEQGAGKPNPFDVLAQLKAGQEHQES